MSASARRRRARRARLIAAVLLAAIGCAPDARADFRVCNRTRALVNLAVGDPAGDAFATEGWWTATPGSCSTPIRGDLKGRFVYLYATNIFGVDLLRGTVSMCVDRGKFRVVGIENCWRRGFQAVNFVEVDTLGEPEWTTFVTDAGK